MKQYYTEAERVSLIIDTLFGGNGLAFAEKVGIDNTCVSRLRNGKMTLGAIYRGRILAALPEVSREWLMTGEGYPGDLSVALVRDHYENKILVLTNLLDRLEVNMETQRAVIEKLLK